MQDFLETAYGQLGSAAAAGGQRPAPFAGGGFVRLGSGAESVFGGDQMLLFQKRTALFMQRSFPAYAQTLTQAELEKLAVNAQKRAAVKGFMTEREIWHYLIAIVYCGFFFEQDMQYADMLRLISWQEENADKMLLLENLLSIIDEYALECEKDFTDFDKKLKYLAEFYTSPQFRGSVLDNLPAAEKNALGERLLADIFPHRLALWTEETRQKLIRANLSQAQRIGLSVKDGLLYLTASIYFGRGFEQSPLYPWAYFLQNRNIPAPERMKHFAALLQKHFSQLAAA